MSAINAMDTEVPKGYITINELIAKWEKDPSKKAELARAREWVRRNWSKIVASIKVEDITDQILGSERNKRNGY
jgi:hypothetical protein